MPKCSKSDAAAINIRSVIKLFSKFFRFHYQTCGCSPIGIYSAAKAQANCVGGEPKREGWGRIVAGLTAEQGSERGKDICAGARFSR